MKIIFGIITKIIAGLFGIALLVGIIIQLFQGNSDLIKAKTGSAYFLGAVIGTFLQLVLIYFLILYAFTWKKK